MPERVHRQLHPGRHANRSDFPTRPQAVNLTHGTADSTAGAALDATSRNVDRASRRSPTARLARGT